MNFIAIISGSGKVGRSEIFHFSPSTADPRLSSHFSEQITKLMLVRFLKTQSLQAKKHFYDFHLRRSVIKATSTSSSLRANKKISL